MKKSRLFLKTSAKHAEKRKLAKAYKRQFKGVCGSLNNRDLARRLHATKPAGDK